MDDYSTKIWYLSHESREYIRHLRKGQFAQMDRYLIEKMLEYCQDYYEPIKYNFNEKIDVNRLYLMTSQIDGKKSQIIVKTIVMVKTSNGSHVRSFVVKSDNKHFCNWILLEINTGGKWIRCCGKLAKIYGQTYWCRHDVHNLKIYPLYKKNDSLY